MCRRIGKKRHLSCRLLLWQSLLGCHPGLCHVPGIVVAKTDCQLEMLGVLVRNMRGMITAVATLASLYCDYFPGLELAW